MGAHNKRARKRAKSNWIVKSREGSWEHDEDAVFPDAQTVL